MKAFFQLYLANVKEFVRDRMAMFWTLAFPVFFIVLFGVVFSGDTSTTFDVGVAVEDQGSLGAALGKVFGKVDAFKVTEGTRDELLAKLKKGDLRGAAAVSFVSRWSPGRFVLSHAAASPEARRKSVEGSATVGGDTSGPPGTIATPVGVVKNPSLLTTDCVPVTGSMARRRAFQLSGVMIWPKLLIATP